MLDYFVLNHLISEQGEFVKHMQYTEIAIDLDVIERLFNALTAAQGCKYTVNQSKKTIKGTALLTILIFSMLCILHKLSFSELGGTKHKVVSVILLLL